MSTSPSSPLPVVGLMPAAGRGTRLGLAHSKEIHPIPGRRLGGAEVEVDKAVCEYLLEYYVRAGIETVWVILTPQKTDLRTHLESLTLDLEIRFAEIERSRSVLETLSQAFSFLEDKRAALGFPDILLEPQSTYRQLIAKQETSGADLVMGLFPTDQDERSDMVELGEDGRVQKILIKQPSQGLHYTWAAGVWTPAFTSFLRDFVAGADLEDESRELHTSEAVQAAIAKGWHIETVAFEEGEMLDIGTPEGLDRVLRRAGNAW